jgi:hypothetical protein
LRLTSSSAVTAPKYLQMPRASITGVMSLTDCSSFGRDWRLSAAS